MRKKIIREILLALSLLRKTITRSMAAKISRMKISHFQLAIIDFLSVNPGVSAKDIAGHFSISMASVSDPLEQLVKMRLVKRKNDSKDRRISRLWAETKGKKMVDRIMNDIAQDLFSVVSEKDLTDYLRVIKKISLKLEKNKK